MRRGEVWRWGRCSCRLAVCLLHSLRVFCSKVPRCHALDITRAFGRRDICRLRLNQARSRNLRDMLRDMRIVAALSIDCLRGASAGNLNHDGFVSDGNRNAMSVLLILVIGIKRDAMNEAAVVHCSCT